MNAVQLLSIESLPLVTPTHPARDDGIMDVARCAALHNFLALHGWIGLGNSLDDLIRESFFDRYGDEAEALRHRLGPQMVEFLHTALVTPETLFIFVSGINEPSYFFQGEDLMPDENDRHPDRFVVLYSTNIGLGEHGVGLLYDLHCHRATLTLGIEDVDFVVPVEEHGEMWHPLETILTRWIELIQVGKVTTRRRLQQEEDAESHDAAESDSDSDSDKKDDGSFADPQAFAEYEPWVWHSYGLPQVTSTIASFHGLVAAIESRLPTTSGPILSASLRAKKEEEVKKEEETAPLVSKETLDEALVPARCFIRSFLTGARRPVFKYIAPGLRLPPNESGSAFTSIQQFSRVQDRVEAKLDGRKELAVPPILIFPAADLDSSHTSPRDRSWLSLDKLDDELWLPYRTQLKALREEEGDDDDDAQVRIPPGLYSESVERWDIDSAEEGFRLLLPFALSGRHARKSDGSLIDAGRFASLFQHGFKPFGGEWWRAQRMERLFDHWKGLVERGVWRVGRDGVEGSVDEFRNADNSESWRDYWIPPSW